MLCGRMREEQGNNMNGNLYVMIIIRGASLSKQELHRINRIQYPSIEASKQASKEARSESIINLARVGLAQVCPKYRDIKSTSMIIGVEVNLLGG